MHDNDSFRLIDPEEAVGIVGCLIVLALLADWLVPEPKVEPPPRLDCPITIAQYDVGERWNPKAPQPTCAQAAAELPNHILTKPVPEKK